MIGLVASGPHRVFLRSAIEPQVQVDAIGIGAIYALMAVGIGLVFGVLRLVNFAYGQLVMAGAFALAFASDRDWPVWLGIVLCFAVVIALSIAMDRVVFRPLRTQSPATMLVATFAVAFLLQAIALLIDQSDDTLGEPGRVAREAQPAVDDLRHRRAEDHRRRDRHRRRLPRRAGAVPRPDDRRAPDARRRDGLPDGATHRRAGEPRDRLGGARLRVLAAIVAVMLTVQQPLVTSTFALRETIVVLAGVVVGGMNKLLSATLGGFAIGYASGLLGGALPTEPEPVPALVPVRRW